MSGTMLATQFVRTRVIRSMGYRWDLVVIVVALIAAAVIIYIWSERK